MGGGGGGDTTTTTTPWSGQQPYLTDLFGEARGLYQSGVGQQYFPGQTVAGFSPQTQLGLDAMTQRALAGSPVERGMQDYIAGTFAQPQIGLGGAAQGAGQYLGQIGAGQQALGAAAQPMDYGQAAGMAGLGQFDPYQQALGGVMVDARGIAAGAPDLAAASQFAGGATAPWSNVLGGMTQFGGLGEAQQFAGMPQAGALPASQQFVSGALEGGPTDVAQAMGAGAGTIDPAAMAQLGATAGGEFLGANPYLDAAAQQIQDRATRQFTEEIAPAIAAQFGGAGRARRGAAGTSGGGIQGDVLTGAAGDVAEQVAGQLASQVYMPAYEAERGRQIQAAGQMGQLGLGGGQLGTDILRTQTGVAGLGGELFGTANAADLARRQLASQQYLGERGLGQQAAQAGGQLGLGGAGLAADLYGTGGQLGISAGQLGLGGAQAGLQNLATQRALGADIFQGGLDRQLQAGLGLQQGGLGGIGALGDLYGAQQSALGRAGALAPTAAGFDYQNIDRLMQAGALTEDQAQRLIDAERARFDFYQQAPGQALQNYANIVYGSPAFSTQATQGPERSRAAGVLGGAMTGAAMGSVVPGIGTLAGGIMGGLGGLFG